MLAKSCLLLACSQLARPFFEGMGVHMIEAKVLASCTMRPDFREAEFDTASDIPFVFFLLNEGFVVDTGASMHSDEQKRIKLR